MKIYLAFALLLTLGWLPLFAQWVDMNLQLIAGWGNDVQAVDYDLDGDLDLFMAGSTDPSGIGYAQLYRNDGNWVFTPVTTGLTGVYRGFTAWADFDGDGYMDVVLTGRNNEGVLPIAKLYKGTPQHTFVAQNVSWTGINYSWIDVGDYNNDGRPDIVMTGIRSGVDYVKLYRNEGNMNFTEVFAGIENMSAGQCHFVDFDNDGDLDISVLGSGANIIYRNDGTDTFTNINANLHPFRWCSSAWGDFDNDGFPDLIASGEGESTWSYIYRNHGDGNFSILDANIPGVISGSVFWGDYNNDGLLDILIAGGAWHYGPRITSIYKNNGNRTFTLQTTSFVPISSCRAIWADLNNDGKLDIAMAGYTGTGYVAKVYRNNITSVNIAPNPPNVVFDQNSSTISFTNATDDTTPAAGLSYNLRLGTTPGGDDIISVLEDPSGYRRIVKNGRHKYYFEPQPLQTYYASAQAIDNAFAGSAFGAELSFSLAGLPMIAFTGADSLDFGSVPIGVNSQIQFVQITNTGTSTLRLNGASFILPNPGFSVVTQGFPFQIAPGASFNIAVRFCPQAEGYASVVMNIFSNAVNAAQLPVTLSGTGINLIGISTPENLQITVDNNSVQLTWDPVTTDIYGNPTTVDRYIILFSEIPEPEYFWYLANTTLNSFTHYDTGLCAYRMFYRVKAIKFDSREDATWLDSISSSEKRRSWQDVSERLSQRGIAK